MFFKVAEPHTCTKVDEHALQAWEQDGVLKVANLVPEEWITYTRKRIVEILGSEPENPKVWQNLKSSLLKPLGRDKRCVSLEAEPVKKVVDDLIGKGWKRPSSGGSWFTNMPTDCEQHLSELTVVPRNRWHWDGRPDLDGSPELQNSTGLWSFTPFTDLLPHKGGTWMVAGSARILSDFFKQLPPEKTGKPTKLVKPWFADTHPWFKRLNSKEVLNLTDQESDAIRLLNVTGSPGDVVFMKPLTIHSAPDYIGPGPRVCHVTGASSLA